MHVIEELLTGNVKPRDAAGILNLSVRQVHRLKKRYKMCGPSGLASKRRGKPRPGPPTDPKTMFLHPSPDRYRRERQPMLLPELLRRECSDLAELTSDLLIEAASAGGVER
jgi:Helix-turn-helix domain